MKCGVEMWVEMWSSGCLPACSLCLGAWLAGWRVRLAGCLAGGCHGRALPRLIYLCRGGWAPGWLAGLPRGAHGARRLQ